MPQPVSYTHLDVYKRQDYDVTILEGSQAMGGISQTVRYNGNRMDIGGHRFFSKNQQVMDWWADLMPLQGKPAYDDKKLGHEKPLAENGPDPETEDNVMLVRDRVSRIYYNKHFFDYPISMTVSYTHLDVYKRQIQHSSFPINSNTVLL